jgi:hypothetical protein
MSIERVIQQVENALDRLPYVETHHDQVKLAADRQQERLKYLETLHCRKKKAEWLLYLPLLIIM